MRKTIRGIGALEAAKHSRNCAPVRQGSEPTVIITKIETFPLRIPAWGDKNLQVADSLLVKVTTDQGLDGWGETFGFRAVTSAKLAIDELIAPLCVGQDATQIASLMLEVQKKLHVFGRGGPLMYGISAVDIALWDIAGKAANAPVYRLLGGGSADLACYASMVRYADASLVRAGRSRRARRGWRRRRADARCELSWTLYKARTRAKELDEFHLKWLEEPLWPPENYDGLAVAESVQYPDRSTRECIDAHGLRALDGSRCRGLCSAEPRQDGRHQRAVQSLSDRGRSQYHRHASLF
jgi:L-alanine-DL-glutamate epimerase-like enolase superfamily enzyme